MLAFDKCGTLSTRDPLTLNSRFDLSEDLKKFALPRGFEQSGLSYLKFAPSVSSQLIVGTITSLATHLEKSPDFDVCPPGFQVC